MGIDIMDLARLQGRHAQGFAHSHKGTLALRRRGGLMESVASITVTAQATQGLYAPTDCRRGCLHDQIGGTFAEIEAGAVSVERSAWLVIEDHQRVESVQVEKGETFRTSHHDSFCQAASQHVGTSNDGISG